MIGQRYREKKTAVLDVWRRYQSLRGHTEDGVDPALLDLRARALDEGRYVLAVVGETKAGKSTLINALLGERILPTDVLQSSSAIVEIYKSDEKCVKIRYADGHIEVVKDDLSTPDIDEAFEHLRRIGALQDRFRSIPTALIDSYIIQGDIGPGKPIPFEDLQNVSQMPLNGKQSVVEEYVRERSLDKIPVEITFGFPLRYEFDELRLVDSPGVNALGGVQDRTFAYLHNANAVLFVHSLEGPVEKSSFRDFITHVIPNRTKQSLFLVLSKSGSRSLIEIEEKIEEARSLFSEEFDPERVLYVDSMFKIMSNDILSFGTALEMKAHYAERKKFFEEKYLSVRRQDWRDEAVNYDTKLRLLTNVLESIGNDADQTIVQAELMRLSNFDKMETAIEEFSAKAPELQLSELLLSVKNGYDNQVAAIEQDIDLLTKKKEHPQTFENEISEIQRVLSEYQLLMHQFVDSINNEYTGGNASYRDSLDQLKSDYIQKIENASDSDNVKRVLANFHDANCAFVDGVSTEMRGKFEAELRRRGEEFKTEHSVTVPTVDISGIEARAKESAYRDAEVAREPKGFWEWTQKILSFGKIKFTEITKEFDVSLFLANYKSHAKKIVNETASADFGLVSSLLDHFTKSFRRSLKSLVESRNKALEEIKVRKSANQEILRDIAVAEGKKKAIGTEVRSISEMLEDLH